MTHLKCSGTECWSWTTSTERSKVEVAVLTAARNDCLSHGTICSGDYTTKRAARNIPTRLDILCSIHKQKSALAEAARLCETSYPQSTCPGMSTRCLLWSGRWSGTIWQDGNVTHLDPLCSIHKQKGALAGSQAAGDLVAEVHVPRSVYQIDQVVLTPVVVDQRHCLGLQ